MRFSKNSYVVPCLFILLSVASQVLSVPGQAPTPSLDLIEVVLVPDKATIMLGEPTYLSFVVKNHSESDLDVIIGGDYRNRLGRPESFAVDVLDKNGKSVPQPDAGPNFGGLIGPRKLPAKGNYTFRLFLPHWAAFETTGTYSITAKRILSLAQNGAGRWSPSDKTRDIQAQASSSIRVVPRDTNKMGEIIRALGDAMINKEYGDRQDAARAMSYIQDVRVIPFFVKALESRQSEQKVSALHALAKFNTKAAFEALKRGMDTQGKDIGNTTTIELANQSAENIRHAAAAALSKSPHPQAISFLISRRSDPSEAVRITILHALGKMKPEKAIPILREMSNDNSKRVSDEAKRYMELLSTREKRF